MKHRVAGLLDIAVTAGVITAVVSASRARAVVTTAPPAELVKMGSPVGTGAKAFYGDLHRTWYDWNTVDQSIRVTRREREAVGSVWSEQVQELSASYAVTDARVRCFEGTKIRRLFVSGAYPNGDACIEEWSFKYPKTQQIGGYVPISERPLPKVTRTELYRGRDFGNVSAVEPDPEGRFVLFLTFETRTVYRIDLPAGMPYPVLSTSEVPELAYARQVVARHHVQEGRSYHFYESPRWEADLSFPRSIVILPDANDDGSFEDPLVITSDDWEPLGYGSSDVWVEPCG